MSSGGPSGEAGGWLVLPDGSNRDSNSWASGLDPERIYADLRVLVLF